LEVTSFFHKNVVHLIQCHIITTGAGPVSLLPKDKVSEVEDDMSFLIEVAHFVVSFLEAFPNLVFCHNIREGKSPDDKKICTFCTK
jgi:hypothetical protein